MASMTLIQIVQDILSDMDSDEVSSINDSVESLQVAQIVKSTYYNIIDGKDFPFLYELFQLTPTSTVSRPTHMSLPDSIIDLKWIKYDNKELGATKNLYQVIQYRTPEEFLNITDNRDSGDALITVVNDSTGIKINVYNDRGPSYFTSFDDENLVFDSYDSVKEVNLTANNTQCHGKKSVAFTLTDAFTPDLPDQMFTYLLAEAKSTCFLTLKQMPNAKAEQVSVSHKRRMSQEAWRIKNGITYPHYGRK